MRFVSWLKNFAFPEELFVPVDFQFNGAHLIQYLNSKVNNSSKWFRLGEHISGYYTIKRSAHSKHVLTEYQQILNLLFVKSADYGS